MQRLEDARAATERRDQERRDRERNEQERLAQDRKERERQDLEARLHDLRTQQQREQERLASARAETERVARTKSELEQIVVKRLGEERDAEQARQQSATRDDERRATQEARRREEERQNLAAIEQENLQRATDAARRQAQAEVCSRESADIHRLAGLRRKDDLAALKANLACPGLRPSIDTALAQIGKAQDLACTEEERGAPAHRGRQHARSAGVRGQCDLRADPCESERAHRGPHGSLGTT